MASRELTVHNIVSRKMCEQTEREEHLSSSYSSESGSIAKPDTLWETGSWSTYTHGYVGGGREDVAGQSIHCPVRESKQVHPAGY